MMLLTFEAKQSRLVVAADDEQVASGMEVVDACRHMSKRDVPSPGTSVNIPNSAVLIRVHHVIPWRASARLSSVFPA